MYRNTCGWAPGLTKSFRNGSRKLWGEYGTNLQNQPDDLRRIYIPDEGKVLVQVDQSGAEALIVAHEAPAGIYRQLFYHGVKVHSWLALHLFRDYWMKNTPYDIIHLCALSIPDLANHPEWKKLAKIIKESDSWDAKRRFYFIAKMVVHASSYGMKGPTFQLNVLQKSQGSVVLTRKQADEFLQMCHDLFPEIRLWHNIIKEQLLANRTLRNLFGFPRFFSGYLDDKLWKEAYAFIPQSTVGCISNIALCNLQSYIESARLDWDILNNCHDSYLAQVPIAEVVEAVRIMLSFMEQDLVSTSGVKFRMRAEASTGMNWGKFHKENNPEGMDEYRLPLAA